ncbi:MAG: hypothetical protein GY939_10710 [Actinomycetia bacterium]|nr:hypothetical protein [Actinomycetes bacterium]
MTDARPDGRDHHHHHRHHGPLVQDGWVAAGISLAMALALSLLVIMTTTTLKGVVVRVEIAAVLVLIAGVGIGSERLIALATAPVLAGAAIAFFPSDQLLWGRSLVAGCLWYVAVEAGLASIEYRDGVQRATAVARKRINEVVTVVALAAFVGGLGAVMAAVAPERTLLMRALGFAALVLVLVWALRQILGSSPRPGS